MVLVYVSTHVSEFPINTILAWIINNYHEQGNIIITNLLLPLGHISNTGWLRLVAPSPGMSSSPSSSSLSSSPSLLEAISSAVSSTSFGPARTKKAALQCCFPPTPGRKHRYQHSQQG